MVSGTGPKDLEERIACLEMLLSCKQKVPSELNVLECLQHLKGDWSRVLGSLPSEVRDVLRVTGEPVSPFVKTKHKQLMNYITK